MTGDAGIGKRSRPRQTHCHIGADRAIEVGEAEETEKILGHGIRSILRNGAQLMGVHWLETGLRLLYLPVMARCLGADLYGQWAYGTAAYGLVLGLIGFGLPTLIPIRLGADREGAAPFVGLTFTLSIALALAAAVGLAVYALVGEVDPTSRTVLLCFVPALIGRSVSLWARVCFLGCERMGAYVRIATLLRSGETGCGILYLLSGGGLLGVVAIHTLFWVVEGVLGPWWLRLRLVSFTPRFDRREAAGLLRQGAVLGLGAGMFTWLTAGPVILFRHAGGEMAELGQFALALNVTMILVASVSSFYGAALPVLSRSAGRSDPRLGKFGRWTLLAAAASAGVAATLGWLLGPSVAVWALGPAYGTAGRLIGWLLLIGGLVLAPTGYGQVLLVSGRRWPGAIANLAAGITLAALFPPAVSGYGLHGAVAATGFAWLVRAILMIAWGSLQSKPLRDRAAAGDGEQPGDHDRKTGC